MPESHGTMQRNSSTPIFLIVLVGALAFVWLTSRALPDVVASHFVASGIANGFMPRTDYVRLMLLILVIVPVTMAYLPALSLNSPKARINLPNKEYWLAPIRRGETIRVLHAHMVRAATMLLVFLSYVHWLVVRANMLKPPSLPSGWFIGGLIAFILTMLVWSWLLIARFRKLPQC